MKKIVIVGAGVMGSAFGQMLVDAGHDVHLVGTHLDHTWVQSIRATRRHPKLNVTLSTALVPWTDDQLEKALADNTELIVLGVNSAGVNWAVEQLGPLLKRPIPLLMLTKGLAIRDDTIRILPTIVQGGLARYGQNVSVAAVAGPCIAGELAVRRESSVILTHPDQEYLQWLLELVHTPYYHARGSTDIVGVEACAALKNFYALAIGYPEGLLETRGDTENKALMHNLAAGLFTQALQEMRSLVEYMGGNADSVYGLPGAGDLYVTCQAGRNKRMGRLLGTGLRYHDAKARYMADDTVEGAELALTIGSTLEKLFQQGGLDAEALPLTRAIIQAICHNTPLQIPWLRFYR